MPRQILISRQLYCGIVYGAEGLLGAELRPTERAAPSVKDLKFAIILDHGWIVYINTTSTVESRLKTIGCGLLLVSVVECWAENSVKTNAYALSYWFC